MIRHSRGILLPANVIDRQLAGVYVIVLERDAATFATAVIHELRDPILNLLAANMLVCILGKCANTNAEFCVATADNIFTRGERIGILEVGRFPAEVS